jgi:tryptophanyl-tRNA synthetase
MAPSQKSILSGMRPTGKLHLGNYWGALSRWLELQADPAYKCFFMVADLHALTTGYENTADFKSNIEEMVLDWLSAGLDPEKSVIFQQSKVSEHAELSLLFSMMTPLGWLERIPTYKEQLRELSGREIATHGFLGYPVLQAADILLYKGEGVPVGEDQVSHVEFTLDVARRFNRLYGPVFPEPKALLTRTPKVPGLDNKKMSKSYGNAIDMADDEAALQKKVSRMFTDPTKARATDLGHPEGCVVFAFHKLYNPQWAPREEECRGGKIGCVACKKDLLSRMVSATAPLRERRAALNPRKAWDVLEQGNEKARVVARATLNEAMKAMRIR